MASQPTSRKSRDRTGKATESPTSAGDQYETETTRFSAATDRAKPEPSGHGRRIAQDEPEPYTDETVEDPVEDPQIEIDGETFRVVEYCIPMDADDYESYKDEQAVRAAQATLRARSRLTDALVTPGGASTSALVAVAQDGKITRWAPGVILTYCVLRETFPDDAQYQVVVDNMKIATQDWMETCGVEFEYLPDLDSSATVRPDGVVFPVRNFNSNGAFIAAAFFPTDMKSRWRMLIDPSYRTTSFDKVGVLRHELGHALGFRHEHLRPDAPPICPDESAAETMDLTPYDPQSVMHYFCGGVGSKELAITEVDRAGSQLVYGPPLYSNFILLEP